MFKLVSIFWKFFLYFSRPLRKFPGLSLTFWEFQEFFKVVCIFGTYLNSFGIFFGIFRDCFISFRELSGFFKTFPIFGGLLEFSKFFSVFFGITLGAYWDILDFSGFFFPNLSKYFGIFFQQLPRTLRISSGFLEAFRNFFKLVCTFGTYPDSLGIFSTFFRSTSKASGGFRNFSSFIESFQKFFYTFREFSVCFGIYLSRFLREALEFL